MASARLRQADPWLLVTDGTVLATIGLPGCVASPCTICLWIIITPKPCLRCHVFCYLDKCRDLVLYALQQQQQCEKMLGNICRKYCRDLYLSVAEFFMSC